MKCLLSVAGLRLAEARQPREQGGDGKEGGMLCCRPARDSGSRPGPGCREYTRFVQEPPLACWVNPAVSAPDAQLASPSPAQLSANFHALLSSEGQRKREVWRDPTAYSAFLPVVIRSVYWVSA